MSRLVGVTEVGVEMPAKKETVTDAERAKRIREAARELGTDNDPKSFEQAFGKVVKKEQPSAARAYRLAIDKGLLEWLDAERRKRGRTGVPDTILEILTDLKELQEGIKRMREGTNY